MVFGLALIALTLRPSLTSVGPLLPEMEREIPLSTTAAAVLTSLPLLSFALVSPLTPTLLRRYRIERVLTSCLLVLAAGLFLRIAPGVLALLSGTIVIGSSIAVMNVVLPVVVKRDAPHRARLVTGLYAMAMTFGASLGSGLTVPFTDLTDSGWQAGLALWIVLVIPAAAFWIARARGQTRSLPPDSAIAATPARRVDWPVTLFFGLQSGVFYAAISWVPSALQDQGVSSAHAGALVSVALLIGIPVSLIAPQLVTRRGDHRPYLAAFVLAATVGLVGLALVPAAALVWMIIFGIGIGATFPLGLAFIVERSADPRDAERRSSVAQTVGYSLAVAGPLLVGALHDLSRNWTLPLVFLAAVMLIPTMLTGLAAAPRRGVTDPNTSLLQSSADA